MANLNLNKAKKEKNDEFYTRMEDIEKELYHYHSKLKGKIVYCNCDDYRMSKFFKFFSLQFETLGLKKLICTGFNKDGHGYYAEYNGLEVLYKELEGNGSFDSAECIEILKESDVVVTNPPFSLFRDFVSLLNEYDKEYLIIGNQNAIKYKEVFPLIKDNKMWLGVHLAKEFTQPNGSTKKFGNIGWFTNISIEKRHENLILYKKYTPEEYPKYDNYDAINVDKTCDIPEDYMGCMGVPITFLNKYNPEQFEILGLTSGSKESTYNLLKYGNNTHSTINNIRKYARIIIKRK